MSIERIERAFGLLLENTQHIQSQLRTNSYDALIEQNAAFLGQSETDFGDQVRTNHQALKDLNLTAEEWRRAYQFLLIKIGTTEPLQANHQMTPDAIAFLMLYLMESLCPSEQLDLIEIGSGMGNLAQTLLNHSSKHLDYLGIELDDLLIDLSASITEVMGSSARFVQEDAVRPQILKACDLVLSDLPVGYYPNDEIASRFTVAVPEGHTYAHHLLMEQSLKYLKKDGIAIFLAPTNLLNSPQADHLKKWLREQATLLALVHLPEQLFGDPNHAKSIFVLKKQGPSQTETFLYPLQDLQDRQAMMQFMTALTQWKEENMKF